MTKIKNSKGITLATLAIYIASLLFAIAILATVTAYFRSNLKEMDKQAGDLAEFDRFNLYLLEEVKRTDNNIKQKVTGSMSIEFTSGNKYEFIKGDRAIYLIKGTTEKIAIANKINECNFSTRKEDEKTIISVNITIGEETKTPEYVLESNSRYLNYEDENTYIH